MSGGAWFDDPDATEDRWREAFERAWRHVPLSLYDEDAKPSERAFGEMLDALHRVEVAAAHAISAGREPRGGGS